MMKKILMAGIAAATMMMAAVPAAAQIQFTGSTAGCFGAACSPTAFPTGGTVTLDGLSFTGGTFNQSTDANGQLNLGGSFDNLGTFALTGAAADYNNDVFRLLVTFTAPAGASSALGSTFTSMLSGIVTSSSTSGVFVNFDNSARLFASAAGPFSLVVNDVSVSAGSTAQILSGQIQAPVPEPGTWAMMLLGFGGMGVALRRRRKLTTIAQLA